MYSYCLFSLIFFYKVEETNIVIVLNSINKVEHAKNRRRNGETAIGMVEFRISSVNKAVIFRYGPDEK